MGQKGVAWNGMSFSVPHDWAPVTIKKNHLIFEKNLFPAMEIKWFRNARDPFKDILQQLTGDFSTLSNPPSRTPTPAEWETYLGAFENQSFSWEDGKTRATGVVLHCKHCQTAIVVQFFSNGKAPPFDAGIEFFPSLQDHLCDNRWSLFDFQAILPKQLELQSFSFQAGRFELHFGANQTIVSLYRFAVAQELLRGKTLGHIADELLSLNRSALTFADDEIDACQWYSRKHGFFARLTARMTRTPLARWGRVWHDPRSDKLLAVQASGGELDFQELLTISSRFCVI
jgi:hypothetical protein